MGLHHWWMPLKMWTKTKIQGMCEVLPWNYWYFIGFFLCWCIVLIILFLFFFFFLYSALFFFKCSLQALCSFIKWLPQCSQNSFPEDGIKVFGSFLHQHTAGKALKLRHIRSGKELAPLDINLNYEFSVYFSRFPFTSLWF